MDKLLRTTQNNVGDVVEDSIVIDSQEVSYPEDVIPKENYFANLGAPRVRQLDEYTPSVILEERAQPIKMKTPHFKLIPAGVNFEETSTASMVKYGILALFIGISVTSFLTQGVLAVKDMVFGPSNSEMMLAEQNANLAGTQNLQSMNTNQVLADSQSAQGKSGNEALGSDDSSEALLNGSSSNSADLNQYSIANEANFPKLSSKSYLAADLQTGEIILEQNDTLVAPIASVSKLMTAVIAEEHMDMQKLAIVSRDSYNTYGTQGELLLGEKIKVYDLMYPLLTESSNDAAEVLADAYDKGHDAFMALMNKKAVELGMNDTYYEDPSGLNPKNVSSVHDLLKLGRYIYQKHPNLYSMTRVRQYAILKHTWFNQNRFLNYDTFLGGKNGYIDESKKTTVSLFDVTMARGGKRQVVIVLLKSDDREGDALKIINFLKKNAYYQEVSTAVN